MTRELELLIDLLCEKGVLEYGEYQDFEDKRNELAKRQEAEYEAEKEHRRLRRLGLIK